MTTEDDFQRALDENPDDWQTRLVFADWLQERDDPRAEGYRALGALNKFARRQPITSSAFGFTHPGNDRVAELRMESATLPSDWWSAAWEATPTYERNLWWFNRHSRCGAEDAAALAFAKLPASRRAELLTGEAVTA